ncbi:MAG: extracellular solute-binding protein [Oscillospiraceae bacterium]|nr:extracellular solute-binding protein [Oscillospiraceae bacterium]
MIRRTLAGLAAVTMCAALASCGGSSTEAPTETTQATTTGVTVEVITTTLQEEDQKTLDDMANEMLPDVELENKTVKWLAHYDINPNTSSGTSESINLNLFRTKYGGEIQYYPTTWNSRYSDLSTYVLGGEGIDFFPCDTAALPKGIISGMFQPVDDYVDLSSDLWKDVSEGLEIYNFNGKHYELVNSISAEQICLYNKKTIEEHGFDDPWELYEKGEWNWDTFEQMLIDFVDPEAELYGLDYWYNEKALLLSAGVPSVSTVDGHLKVNLNDPDIEKALDWQYGLNQKGLVMDLAAFDWTVHPEYLSEGKELFLLVGSWDVSGVPEVWPCKVAPEDLGIVPVPSPAGYDNFQSATLDGWVICKGAANPEGVALLAQCTRLANTNDEARAIADKKLMDEAQWSEELLAHNNECNRLAAEFPVVDLATGISTDVASLTTDGGSEIGLRAAFHGTPWATTREEIAEVVEMLVEEADGQLSAMS